MVPPWTVVLALSLSGGPRMGDPEPHGAPRLSPATGNQINPRVAISDGSAVVWEDDRAGGPGLWATKVERDGGVPLLFGSRISSTAKPSAPTIAAGPGHWLLTWMEGVPDTQTVQASVWTLDGTEVVPPFALSPPGHFTPPSSVWVQAGFVSVWSDLQAPQLVGARLESDGGVRVVNMSTPSYADSASAACGNGTCLVVFISPGSRWDVLGRFFDPVTLAFTSPEFLVTGTSGDEYWPTVGYNQAAGVFVVSWWERLGDDVFVGTVPADGGTTVNSRLLEGTAAAESQPDISCSADGLDLCAVALRGANAAEVHLWRIRGDLSDVDAMPQIWPAAVNFVGAPAVSLGQGAGMLVWHGTSPGYINGDDVYGVMLDGMGQQVGAPQLLSAASNGQRVPHLARQGDRHWLLWRDDARSPGLANYQVSIGGPGNWSLDDLDVSFGAFSFDRGIVVPLQSDALAIWGDDGPAGRLTARRMTRSGGMGPTELALTSAGYCRRPASATLDGVSWIATSCSGPGLWMGAYRGGAFGEERLATDPDAGFSSVEPALETDGNELRLVWTDDRLGSGDVFGARFDRDGGALGAPDVPLVVAPGWQGQSTVAVNGGTWLVAWQDEQSGRADILAQRFGAGWQAIDAAPFRVSQVDGARRAPRALPIPGGFFLAWEEDSNRGDLVATTIDLDGAVGEAFAIASAPDWEGEVSLAPGAVDGEVLVAYSAFDPDDLVATRRVYTRWISFLADPVPPEPDAGSPGGADAGETGPPPPRGIFGLGCDCSAGGGALLWWGLGALALLRLRFSRSGRVPRR